MNRTELCDLLSDGIANQGILQTLYHSEYILRDASATLATNPGYLSEIVNKQSYVEFGYSYAEMFFEAEVHLLNTIKDSMGTFVEQGVELVITQILVLMVIFISTSLLCMGNSLRNIDER